MELLSCLTLYKDNIEILKYCGSNDGQNKLRERWEQMSPEERQRIIELHKCNDTEAAPDGK